MSDVDALVQECDGLELKYHCRLERLPANLRDCFVQLGRDRSLEDYLRRAKRARHGRLMTGLHRALRGYLSDFDINGVLGTYPMHILGTEQWRFLLGSGPATALSQTRLLDVGAGNGDVTEQLQPLFDEVITTEMSRAMAWRLGRRGFSCHRLDIAASGVPNGPYAAISCLNVLDRCDRPLRLLANLRAGLEDQGMLILALVLPYQPLVYEGANSRDPSELLPLKELDWETSVAQFCSRIIEPLGLRIEAIARAPYLSGGDSRRPLYELDDALVVCRAQGKALIL